VRGRMTSEVFLLYHVTLASARSLKNPKSAPASNSLERSGLSVLRGPGKARCEAGQPGPATQGCRCLRYPAERLGARVGLGCQIRHRLDARFAIRDTGLAVRQPRNAHRSPW